MKKILVIAALALGASWGHASELYWTVGDGALTGYQSSDNVGLYAVWGVFTQNVGSDSRATPLATLSVEDLLAGAAMPVGLDGVGSSDHPLSSYYFFLEISGAGGRIAATDKIAYTDLLAAGAIGSGAGMSAPINAYGFSDFSSEVVPEPSSGLLVLIGALALGLKRKKELV